MILEKSETDGRRTVVIALTAKNQKDAVTLEGTATVRID